VNKSSKGARKAGSGRGKKTSKPSPRKADAKAVNRSFGRAVWRPSVLLQSAEVGPIAVSIVARDFSTACNLQSRVANECNHFRLRTAMRYATILGLAALLTAAGCNDSRSNNASNGPSNPSTAKDNTGVNERDRSAATKTPIDQNENQKDIDVTAQIRKQVVDSKLSVNAQNVKIITQDGKVTLRGPVRSAEEKQQIEQIAGGIAGPGNVDSQLEIQP
jgi:hyperosmotically inducible protein